ncbi:MAG: hypothetical protein LW823_02665 [Rickettsiales bacterium]|jgi:hypothetical protein|nr:hypothetical protein [Rickettsiales bacterium]
MQESEFREKIATRASTKNVDAIVAALKKHNLIEKLEFLADGTTTSVFEIKGSGLVLKFFDRRERKNERISGSRYHLRDYFRGILLDETAEPVNGRLSEVVIEIEPKLSAEKLTTDHQEMVRYKLWTEEGIDFYDIWPPLSDRKAIKNVLLDARGVPYQIDEDASRKDDDYPRGKKSKPIWEKEKDKAYQDWRADQLDNYGKPDAISDEKLSRIKAACDACDWPVKQTEIFDPLIDHQKLDIFAGAFREIEPFKMTYSQEKKLRNIYREKANISLG